MNITLFCALICQHIVYWDSGQVIDWCGKRETVKQVLNISEKLDGDHYDYGFSVLTWGATLKKCETIPAKTQLQLLGYFVEFDGDGKVCR